MAKVFRDKVKVIGSANDPNEYKLGIFDFEIEVGTYEADIPDTLKHALKTAVTEWAKEYK